MGHRLETQPRLGASSDLQLSALAAKPAPKAMLIDAARLEREYFERRPDISDRNQLVSFGTSGHRGSPLSGTFTESHILAITQAICDYRREQRTDGPLYMGKDTHALSAAAQRTALEVLAANGVETFIQERDGVTPTPVISRAILVYNQARKEHFADGIVITNLAWSSTAALAIAPLQNLLNLERESRRKVPGRADGNWRWRFPEETLSLSAFEWLQELTERSRRSELRQISAATESVKEFA